MSGLRGLLRSLFLMYRVELKDWFDIEPEKFKRPKVPNVPCGVERQKFFVKFLKYCVVPNVPCGVER